MSYTPLLAKLGKLEAGELWAIVSNDILVCFVATEVPLRFPYHRKTGGCGDFFHFPKVGEVIYHKQVLAVVPCEQINSNLRPWRCWYQVRVRRFYGLRRLSFTTYYASADVVKYCC